MKKIYLIAAFAVAALSAQSQLALEYVSTYHTGIYDEGAAEIVAFDEGSKKLFFCNANDNSIGILDFTDPADLQLIGTIDMDAYGDGVNSVSVYEGTLAAAVEVDEAPGKVVFFNHDGTYISQVQVGHLPDMVTFSHDGNTVVAACEGEPSNDWLYDPAGTVAIIDVSGGAAGLTQTDVQLVEIGDYTGSWAGVRLFGPDTLWALNENFQDTALELNEFETFNEYSTGTWYYDDFGSDYFAEANGFGDDTASADWLISAAFDLSSIASPMLSFVNTKNFGGGALHLLVSADYDGGGNPLTATWDTLTGQVTWSAGGYADTPSGNIDLSAYSGGMAYIAFLYTSTSASGGGGALWQIDDIKVWGSIGTASNIEPEYVAISVDNSKAFVSLQENNALAVINLSTGAIENILPLGWKDHSLAANALDASDRDDTINITTHPFRGLYLPDAVTAVAIGGTQYILSANEGDTRDYDAYAEEERVEDIDLDPTAFPDAAALQDETVGGRIIVTSSMGDTDGDGDFDELYTFGGRSFTIWATDGSVVFDSGDDFEQITATAYPNDFNSGNEENDDFDNRSDAKGPEPEAIKVAEIGGVHYAFIGLERIGGVMVYDISDPANAEYVTYVNHRDFTVTDPESEAIGDLGCEDLLVIDGDASGDGNYYVVTSNEISGTVSVFEITGIVGVSDETTGELLTAYPNPTAGELTLSTVGDYTVRDMSGRSLITVKGDKINLSELANGVYSIAPAQGQPIMVVKN